MRDFCAIDAKPGGSQNSAPALGIVTANSQDVSQPTTTAQSPAAQAASTPEDNAAAAEQAVRDQTINFNFPLIMRLFFGPIWPFAPSRLRLKFWARWARWCKRQWGEYSRGEFRQYFNERANHFGKGLKKHISSRLKRRLKGLIDGDGEPFLIVRGVFSRKFPQASLARALEDDPDHPTRKIVGEAAVKLIDEGCYNLIASGLIAATGTELRRKLSGDDVYHDFITETGAEIDQFVDGTDMHLRYRTATPEKTPAANGKDRAARIIVFACIENPIADPIYLIRADDVLRRMSAKEQTLLHEEAFDFFDKWNTRKIAHDEPKPNKRVLYRGASESDYWLSFDPNRLAPKRTDVTAAHNSAVGALMDSIRKVEANKHVRKIVLRRGDALIVDNYRALTRRQEHGYAYVVLTGVWRPWMRIRKRPPVRWLRVYYGFPKE